MQSLFRAINRLPENQKTALILAKIDHESHADIADYMGTTSKAVESLVARAKSNLSKSLPDRNRMCYQNETLCLKIYLMNNS
ncbi:MAG: hypothetical protein H6561_11855 [Lewinellaceae bacterium]|nr:hypothetical protein [Lewinellaceae bacterium]